MKIASIRETPSFTEVAICHLQKAWPGIEPAIYEISITHSLKFPQSLPQWYLLLKDEEIIGCAG
jgi:hypothetical protein